MNKARFGTLLLHFMYSFAYFKCNFYPSGLEGYYYHGPGGRASGGRLPDLGNPYLCNRLTDFLHSKFAVIVWACSGVLSSSFAHLPHMGLPMGQKLVKFATSWVQTLQNAFLWNCRMDLRHLKFRGLVESCRCATSYLFAHLPHMGFPWAKTCQIRRHLGQILRNPYLWNRWMDLYHLKFYGIV